MAYFDKEKNTRVRFSDLSSTYNVSVAEGVKTITHDLAEMLGLYSIVQADQPEYDPETQIIEQDMNASPTFNDETKTVSWPWTVRNMWEDILDEDGNVVKTAEEQKAEFDAAEAEAKANAPTEEELADQQRESELGQELADQKQARNTELLRTDVYVSVPDYSLPNGSTLEDWTTYRASLRSAFDDVDMAVATAEEVRNLMYTLLDSAPDYVAPGAPAEEEAAAE